MQRDLTRGPIARGLLLFALPLQGRQSITTARRRGGHLGRREIPRLRCPGGRRLFRHADDLPDVDLPGLCMGSGTAFSIQYGRRDMERFKRSLFVSFLLIAGITLLLTVLVFVLLDWILLLMQTPPELMALMRQYLWCIFWESPPPSSTTFSPMCCVPWAIPRFPCSFWPSPPS